MILKFFSRLSWFVLFFAAGSIALVTAVLVMTSNGVSIFGIKAPNLPAPAVINVPSPIDPTTGVAASITTSAPLNDVITKRRIFQLIPLPQEISNRVDVIAANIILAFICTLIIGAITVALRNLLRDPESALSKQLAAFRTNPVSQAISKSNIFVQRGCLGLPIILLTFAIYGIIFSVLDPGTYIFSPHGVQLAFIMAMSVGLVSLGGDLALRWVWRFWGNDREANRLRYGVYPANVLVAVFTTAFSRVFGLLPGIMYGVPGGTDTENKADSRSRQLALAVGTLLAVLAIGGLGWAITGLIFEWGKTAYNVQTLQFIAPIASLIQTAGLAVFVVAVQTAFFEMIPLTATIGARLYKWNPIGWILFFAPVAFIFAHTVLNPVNDFYSSFRLANVRTMMLTLPALLFLTLLVWGYFKFLEPILNPQRDIPVDPVVNPFEAGMTVPGATLVGSAPTSVTTTAVHSTRPSISREELGLPPTAPHSTMTETQVHDTQPGKPVEVDEDQSGIDTEPKRPPRFMPAETPSPAPKPPAPKKPKSRYPDPTDPYAGLFPPPQPGDEDYLESEFDSEYDDERYSEDKTPPKGMKPVEVMPSEELPAAAPAVPDVGQFDPDLEPTESQQMDEQKPQPDDETPSDQVTPPPPDNLPL
jgi:hypothetical protein